MIELSLSIAFIAILLIAIAIITTNMIATYRRGLVLKQINNYGTELVNDFQKSVANANVNSIESLCKNSYVDKASDCINNRAKSLINFYDTARIRLARKDSSEVVVPMHGVFCSGTYSYIWNSGYLFSTEDIGTASPIGLKYKSVGGTVTKIDPSVLRILKVLDPMRIVCSTVATSKDSSKVYLSVDNSGIINMSAYYSRDDSDGKYYIDIADKTQLSEEPVELLPLDGGNGNFAFYDLAVDISDQDTLGQNSFYAGSFILGTIEGGVNVKSSGDFCAPPGEYGQSSFDYCAINKFNFAMRAMGE